MAEAHPGQLGAVPYHIEMFGPAQMKLERPRCRSRSRTVRGLASTRPVYSGPRRRIRARAADGSRTLGPTEPNDTLCKSLRGATVPRWTLPRTRIFSQDLPSGKAATLCVQPSLLPASIRVVTPVSRNFGSTGEQSPDLCVAINGQGCHAARGHQPPRTVAGRPGLRLCETNRIYSA